MTNEFIVLSVLLAVTIIGMAVAIVWLARSTSQMFHASMRAWEEASRQALAISEHELSRRKIEVEAGTRIERARDLGSQPMPGIPPFSPTVEQPVGYNGDETMTAKF